MPSKHCIQTAGITAAATDLLINLSPETLVWHGSYTCWGGANQVLGGRTISELLWSYTLDIVRSLVVFRMRLLYSYLFPFPEIMLINVHTFLEMVVQQLARWLTSMKHYYSIPLAITTTNSSSKPTSGKGWNKGFGSAQLRHSFVDQAISNAVPARLLHWQGPRSPMWTFCKAEGPGVIWR